MKCKCNSPKCQNEIFVDSLGQTIMTTKGNEAILIYIDLETATELIRQLTDMRENILNDKKFPYGKAVQS